MAFRTLTPLLVCGILLFACGGEEGGDEGDQTAIERTIVTLSKTDDPADCRKLVTPRFLEETSGVGYAIALAACEEGAVNPLVEDAQTVTVTDVEIDGDAATAVAAYDGSGFDGQTLKIGLVERDGQWKQDDLLAFVEFDPEKMVTELGRELLLRARYSQEAEMMRCVIGQMRKMDVAELEAVALGDKPDLLIQIAEGCASSSSSL